MKFFVFSLGKKVIWRLVSVLLYNVHHAFSLAVALSFVCFGVGLLHRGLKIAKLSHSSCFQAKVNTGCLKKYKKAYLSSETFVRYVKLIPNLLKAKLFCFKIKTILGGVLTIW